MKLYYVWYGNTPEHYYIIEDHWYTDLFSKIIYKLTGWIKLRNKEEE
jgi:hypothetical protein